MIESLEDIIGARGKRLFDQFDTEFGQQWHDTAIMVCRPGLVSIDQQARFERGLANGFHSCHVRAVTTELDLQDREVCDRLCRRCHCFRGIEANRKCGFYFRSD